MENEFVIGLFVLVVVVFILYFVSHYYPYSLQVFYPNHPNITITQNCEPFTILASSYLNGQPINPKNTTICVLPSSMAKYDSNPFNCNIIGKNITCTGYGAPAYGAPIISWKGTILNVSKR